MSLLSQGKGTRDFNLSDLLDRNPTEPILSFRADAVAPHAETVRVSRVIASGRNMLLFVLNLRARRASAATTVGKWGASFRISASDYVFDKLITKNAIDDSIDVEIYLGMIRLASQSLALTTQDSSTGGTVDYRLTMKGVEIDA